MTEAFIRDRRDIEEPPGEQIADFEEYTRLYRKRVVQPGHTLAAVDGSDDDDLRRSRRP